jgi:flagellar motor switch protein FliG
MSAVFDNLLSRASLGSALRKGLQRPDHGLRASELDGASKATIVLMTLGPDIAADMLKVFAPAEAQKISALMSSVRALDRDLIIDVLEEFRVATEHERKIPFDADGFVNRLLAKFAEEEAAEGGGTLPSAARNMPALEALSRMSPVDLHARMVDEHPQVVATLLALMTPGQSASVLELFDELTRGELVMRVALLNRIDPEVLSELNDVLERSLRDAALSGPAALGGSLPAAEILGNLSGAASKPLLDSIRQFDPALAQQIASKMFIFDDFAFIEPRSLERLLQEVPLDVLAISLKGESPKLRELFFANMSVRQAEKVKFEMEGMPPVRVQDVEARHREMVQMARQMAADGQITLDRVPDAPARV